LDKSGFTVENALIWPVTFQPFQPLTAETLQNTTAEDVLTDVNRAVIQASAVKVILVCGARAWNVVAARVSVDARQGSQKLTLRKRHRVPFLVSTSDGGIPTRLYIQFPELPATPESLNLWDAVRMGEMLKFVQAIARLSGITPYFTESTSIIKYVSLQRRAKNEGAPKVLLVGAPEGITL
jgi:hypothetical protein